MFYNPKLSLSGACTEQSRSMTGQSIKLIILLNRFSGQAVE